ncbi:alpha/beta fold hydrolase [Nocardioides litoris]|uniref:alpha/beta fold hydrolase n=1 Tax=Nocardioides litoris TaxID=1926648 RepID=UPI00111C9C46|nr:alpha/beta hydrolase [Nocardioides litoris]
MAPHVHLTRTGDGPPVVLVHGLGSRLEVFDPVVPALARTHEVVAVDLPGFGRSEPDPAVRPGPVGYADWLVGLLGELGLDRPHVVGSSLGGGVALETGRRGAASAVTAFAPVGFWGAAGRRWCQSLLTVLRAGARAGGPVVPAASRSAAVRHALGWGVVARPEALARDDLLRQLDGLVRAEAFAAARRSFAGYDLTGPGLDLGALPDVPVAVAWGSLDRVLPGRTQAERARRALPFARHLRLEGCGHLPFSDDPEACVALVEEQSAARGPA